MGGAPWESRRLWLTLIIICTLITLVPSPFHVLVVLSAPYFAALCAINDIDKGLWKRFPTWKEFWSA